MSATGEKKAGLRVLQLVNTLAVSDGGPAKNVADLDKALQTLNEVESQVYWFRGRHDQTVLSREVRCGTEALPQKLALRNSTETTARGIISALKDCRHADIVILHGYFLWWVPLVSVLLHWIRTPFVIVPHGCLTARQQKISVLKKWAFESAAGWYVRRRSHSFVAYSEAELQDISSLFPRSEVSLLSIGMDLPDRFRSDAHLNSPVRLLSLSRIAPKKRIDIAISGVRKLLDKGVQVHLRIVGTGDLDLLGTLKDQVRDLRLTEYVEFAGELWGHEKEQAFLESDIFVLPSEDENFGIGFAEAMSYGLPCIVSRHVGAAEKLNGRVGSVLDALTAEAFALSVQEELTKDPGKSREEARRFVAEEFSWQKVAESWKCTLENVIAYSASR